MNFQGKNVLITGGSRGIGKAIALGFAKGGARIILNFKSNNEAARQTIHELEGSGHFAIKADLSDPSAIEDLVTAAIQEVGHIDILVNNAGVYLPHAMDQADYTEWQKAWNDTLQLNLLGPAHLCFQVAGHMRQRGGGRIVNISSRGAFRGEPGHPAYGASKAGLNAMSQSMAVALAPYGIFVGVVAPGFVQTDMTEAILNSEAGKAIRAQSPLGRVATPAEVAHAVLFLASEGAEFTTGTIIDVNGASYLRS
jgi:3-oxoacyl-[acyl-carrier protein] reductase